MQFVWSKNSFLATLHLRHPGYRLYVCAQFKMNKCRCLGTRFLPRGGPNNKKNENLRFFKFLLNKSPILGGPARAPRPPLFRGPWVLVHKNVQNKRLRNLELLLYLFKNRAQAILRKFCEIQEYIVYILSSKSISRFRAIFWYRQ